jgi:ribose 5-phosphate isomerase A
MTRDEMKRAAAVAAIEFVQPGMTIGVGTGSTADWFITLLSELPAARRPAAAVASSLVTAAALRAAGIRVLDPAAAPYPLPLYVDGADEVDPELRLIKGGGGAHTREKAVATASELFVCIVDESKLVDRLGAAPVPLEVVPWAAAFVAERVTALGGHPAARAGFLTDNDNIVVDVTGLELSDPEGLELELDAIPGVVACGIFARRRADLVLVGSVAGVRRLSGRRTP